MQNQVDEMNSKYSSTTKFIEDDYKYKYEKAMSEKDEEMKRLMNKINDLLDYNDKLSMKVDENLRIIDELRKNYSEKIHEMQLHMNKKDSELIDMKNFYESKIDSMTRNFEEEKSRIVNNYEENLNKYYHLKFRLNNGHTMSKDKLSIILNEREKDIHNILEKQQSQEKNYNDLINELKREIASHKENIINRKYDYKK